jgi:hypothetical protein
LWRSLFGLPPSAFFDPQPERSTIADFLSVFLKDNSMAAFCTNCGAPLAGAFCGRCGARAQSAASSAQTQTITSVSQPASPPLQPQDAQSAAAQPSKSSGGGKALLIIGGIVLVLVLAAFGATIYGVHWVKSKISSLTGGAIGSEVGQGNACKLLSTAELQLLLGVTIERSAEIVEGNDPGCAYYTNPAAFAELQKIAVQQARRDSEKASKDPALNSSKNDNPLELLKHTQEMEGIVKGLGLTAPDPTGRVFAFTVEHNFGSGNWGPLRTTLSVVPGFDEINGVGDHAMIGSFGHAFYVLKGNSMFKLETMYVPEARTRGADIARKMISHL